MFTRRKRPGKAIFPPGSLADGWFWFEPIGTAGVYRADEINWSAAGDGGCMAGCAGTADRGGKRSDRSAGWRGGDGPAEGGASAADGQRGGFRSTAGSSEQGGGSGQRVEAIAAVGRRHLRPGAIEIRDPGRAAPAEHEPAGAATGLHAGLRAPDDGRSAIRGPAGAGARNGGGVQGLESAPFSRHGGDGARVCDRVRLALGLLDSGAEEDAARSDNAKGIRAGARLVS